MANGQLLPNTEGYDRLPFSAFIYEPVYQEDGSLLDFKVVYGNQVFIRDWRDSYHNDNWKGALLRESTIMDEYTLRMMEAFLTQPAHPFSTYLPVVNLHIHFEPMTDLEPPYGGFFVTNITDFQKKQAKVHFLRNIRQMKNEAVLARIHEDNRAEVVYVSEDFAKMMECDTVAEAMELMDGPGYLKSTYVEDRPLVKSMLRRRVADDGGTSLTIQKITKKGNRIWCSVHYSFIDDYGEHYVYTTYYNVTVLKEYEERLRSVFISFGNDFYQPNEKTLAMFRVDLTRDSVEEVQGKDLFPCDAEAMSHPYSHLLQLRAARYPIVSEQALFRRTFDRNNLLEGYAEGKVSFSENLYSQRRDGRMCYASYTVNLARHPMNGHVIAFITEQECNEEKVRDALMTHILAKQFDMVSFLTNGHYGVVIGNAARIGKGSIFPVVRQGEYTHYLESQVYPVLSGSEEEKAAMALALSPEEVSRHILTEDPYVVNIAIEMDGEVFYKQLDYFAVDPEGKFCVVLKSDTTAIQREQILRNEQLKLALEEARQANLAKSAFLSAMSHEIRTPMNAIIGLDNIALKDPNVPQRTREHLEKIGVSAQHLLELINDILDMSRIESGRMVLKNEEFSFVSFLEQINTLAFSQCQEKGLRYECAVLGSLDDYYIGDDMKLRQVLINVLGNAVKFTPAPGDVTLTIQQVSKFEGQSTLRFKIKDTGIGMNKEYLPKIFDPFTQEDATTTTRYGGSGLGLAITKNIVELLNGSITVESEKGVGSEFTITVTLKDSERTGALSDKICAQDMRVLVIDDDPAACQHAKFVLEEIGISADTCLSGKEALEVIQLRHARRESYNLILVDLQMPEEDGVEVTRKIRDLTGNDSAIVILTAYSWADDEEKAIMAGVDSFMTKPLFSSSVLSEFKRAMDRKRIIHPDKKEPADLTGRHILLAEDMPINAEIMMELLEMMDMTVEHAENGKLAVEIFAASPPGHFDAVLMDIRMPQMDGLQATEAIRALDRPDAKTVPIIAMTANAFDEDVQRSLQAGMNAHLTKPVEPQRLFDTLGELIREDE